MEIVHTTWQYTCSVVGVRFEVNRRNNFIYYSRVCLAFYSDNYADLNHVIVFKFC